MSLDPKSIKILLAEDAAVMRKIEIKALKALGFERIVEAVDGQVAVAVLEKEKIDLIISDWNMPNMDGLELLQWVRADETCRQLPFLMATGQGDKKQEQKAVQAGVSSFVAKPFDGEELRTKIDEAFGLEQAQSAAAAEAEAPAPVITAGGKVRLKVAHIQITDHLVLGVLKHMIDKGELEPRHFELETLCLPGWNPVQKALEKGSVNAACVLAPIAMDLFNYGVPIKLILLAHKAGSICVRSTQGTFAEPFQDFFRQRSFLIPHKLSIHHMLAHLFFSRIGLTSGMAGGEGVDVNFEVTAPIKMSETLGSNPDACGFMVAEPLGTKSIAAGVARQQFLSSELWQNHPCCVVAMRDDFIDPHAQAVYEFTEMLVTAGQFIAQKPELAAEIGVQFLDPERKLGLKVPILKNVLTEELGIKTADLYPAVEDLDRMQRYMVHEMGIGSLIDLEKFVDTRFAEAACKNKVSGRLASHLHDGDRTALNLLVRGEDDRTDAAKSMLSMEGKYLSFALDHQEYGIDILKIREIIGMQPINSLPQTPPYIKGVINLRGRIIPVMDLRIRFGLPGIEEDDRSCIIVLDLLVAGVPTLIGIAVDSVSDVQHLKAGDIEATPSFGAGVDTRHILAMAMQKEGVKTLLDIDHVVAASELNVTRST